ncbi:hypothetical protein AAMO2058_000121600 [Amorphochlora amoebiformis]
MFNRITSRDQRSGLQVDLGLPTPLRTPTKPFIKHFLPPSTQIKNWNAFQHRKKSKIWSEFARDLKGLDEGGSHVFLIDESNDMLIVTGV